eukprot:288584_1
MSVDELLVRGYIHHTFESEYTFNIQIVTNNIHRTILMFLPKAVKMSISLSLGACIVLQHSNKKYTVYSFNLQMMNESHSFTARYSSLAQFHQSLFENEIIKNSFGDNPPSFPSKNWWKDFTKSENYNERANKLLKYFQALVTKESVITSHIFHNGVYLPKHFRDILSKSTKGYYWPDLPELSCSFLRSPEYSRSSTKYSPLFKPVYPQRYYSKKKSALQNALEDLFIKTDQSFVDVNGHIPMVFCDSYEFIDDLYLFCIDDVLPKYSMECIQRINYKNETNMKLFERMNKKDNDEIDEIVLQIKAAILEVVAVCDFK